MQSVYAPLSQYFSDSDSEKEIIMEQVFTTNWNTNITNINTRKNMIPPEEYQMNNNINQNKVKTKRVRFAMSNSRKAAFVTSVVFCFLPVIVFLWVVPCNNSAICPVKISNWKNAQKFMEFTGKINVIEGKFQEQNLALMYKGSFNDPKMKKNGVLAFSGKSGLLLWNYEQESCPLKMDCNMIDVDQDGFKDCLILDETGLKAVTTLSGNLIWHFHSVQKSSLNPEGLDFPLLWNDANNDGFTDLLLLAKKEVFLIISGQTGNALCSVKFPPCLFIEDVEAVHEYVKFRCIFSNDTKLYYQASFTDINMNCRHLDKNIPLQPIAQNNYTEEENIYQSGKQKLSVNVYGQCPHCQSSVTLFSKKDVVEKSWLYEDALVSAPVSFYMNYTSDPLLKGDINGFIFKVWHWQKNTEELSPSAEVHQRPILGNKKYRLYPVIESVVVLSSYKNFSHDVNVSISDIFLICKDQDLNDCQPDYRYRQYSLLIADLDRDNSLELVRYYSSYKKEKQNRSENWSLLSELTVFRLAKELPKLYMSKK